MPARRQTSSLPIISLPNKLWVALEALQHDAETLKAQSQALSTAGEALHLIQANYQAGTVNYLQVLIADYQFQQAQVGYIQAMGQRFQDTGALFVALRGGWWKAEALNSPKS